jgi:hypothetical protein
MTKSAINPARANKKGDGEGRVSKSRTQNIHPKGLSFSYYKRKDTA